MSSFSADERAWVERARQGDQAAFGAIFQRYERQIYSFIYRMMGDDDAADLTQEVFVKAYRALPRITRELNVSAWLYRIAANACLDVLRRRQRLRFVPWVAERHDHLLLSRPAETPEQSAISQETRATVQTVLNRMTPRHRLALLLREVEGLSCQEIGDTLGLSRSAARSMLCRARDEFRRVLALVDRAHTAEVA